MYTEEDHLNDLLKAARQAVPQPAPDPLFDAIVRRIDAPARATVMPYKQWRALAVAASVILVINIAAWIISRSENRQNQGQPYYLQSYNLNIY